MTREEALAIAGRLASLRPDRGNRYATRTVKTKGAAAYDQWMNTCEAIGFEICTERKVIPLADFLTRCRQDA